MISGELDDDGLPLVHHVPRDDLWLLRRSEPPISPGLPIVDAHHHLWDRGGSYFLSELLDDLASGHNIAATVFVQCGYAYRSSGCEALRPVGETEFVARVARSAEMLGCEPVVCAGIVGHADLTLGAQVEEVLHAHMECGLGRFRGIRQVAARDEHFNASPLGRPPAELLGRPKVLEGLAKLQSMGLSFDAWVYFPQLGQVERIANALPDLLIVLNHCGGLLGVGPYAGRSKEVFGQWRSAMKRLAGCPNVFVKIGGLAMSTTGARFHEQPLPPTSEQLAQVWGPYVETCIELFGARRCMFESNFPVDKAMCSYNVLWNAYKRITEGCPSEEQSWMFKETANNFYHLGLG